MKKGHWQAQSTYPCARISCKSSLHKVGPRRLSIPVRLSEVTTRFSACLRFLEASLRRTCLYCLMRLKFNDKKRLVPAYEGLGRIAATTPIRSATRSIMGPSKVKEPSDGLGAFYDALIDEYGYQEGGDLFAAAFDWRLLLDKDYNIQYFSKLKILLQKMAGTSADHPLAGLDGIGEFWVSRVTECSLRCQAPTERRSDRGDKSLSSVLTATKIATPVAIP